jgi:hypothetical protein
MDFACLGLLCARRNGEPLIVVPHNWRGPLPARSAALKKEEGMPLRKKKGHSNHTLVLVRYSMDPRARWCRWARPLFFSSAADATLFRSAFFAPREREYIYCRLGGPSHDKRGPKKMKRRDGRGKVHKGGREADRTHGKGQRGKGEQRRRTDKEPPAASHTRRPAFVLRPPRS